MRTGSAGTLESMDCLVTVTEATPGAGIAVRIAGGSAARFSGAMGRTVREALSAAGVSDAEVNVQDNGALDPVLSARVQAAVLRMGRTEGGRRDA
jgi:citrate lyase subunit gamma (acyl carrier protein)